MHHMEGSMQSLCNCLLQLLSSLLYCYGEFGLCECCAAVVMLTMNDTHAGDVQDNTQRISCWFCIFAVCYAHCN